MSHEESPADAALPEMTPQAAASSIRSRCPPWAMSVHPKLEDALWRRNGTGCPCAGPGTELGYRQPSELTAAPCQIVCKKMHGVKPLY